MSRMLVADEGASSAEVFRSSGEGALEPFAEPSAVIDGRSRSGLLFQFVSVATWLGDMLAVGWASMAVAPLGGGDQFERVLPIAAVCYTGIVRVAGGYDFDSLLYFKRSWPCIANAWATTVIAITALCYALDVLLHLPVIDIAAWSLCGLLALAIVRAVAITAVRRLKRDGAFDRRTVIVGTGGEGTDLVDHIARTDELAVTLVGFFDDRPIGAAAAAALPLPYLGGMADLVAAVRAGAVDQVFVALPWSEEARLRAIVHDLSATPIEIRLAPGRAGFAYARHRLASMAGLPVITLLERPLSGPQQLQKAAEDRVLAFAALVLLAPLMLVIALAIRLTSPGPVLFRQPREGFNCRPFDILKFRTMRADPVPAGEIIQARRRDPRVTPVGALLRRTSLDELPQLVNVLCGHMSLVGPRPHAPTTRAGGRLFAEVAATYAARHKVKPGLTGWAQVCGWRGETDTEEKLIRRLEHDMYYVEHWSIWFDLYILVRTAATVLVQRSAY